MGRQLRRVPLDFQWPQNEPWEGFINPHYTAVRCEPCDGRGSSPEFQVLCDRWYGKVPFKPEDRGSVPITPEYPPMWAYAERQIVQAPNYYGHVTQDKIFRNAERLSNLFNGMWAHHLNQDDVDALVAADRLRGFTGSWTKDNGWQPHDPPHHPTAREVNDSEIGGFGHDSINMSIVVNAEAKRLGIETHCPHCDGSTAKWPSKAAEKRYDKWKSYEPPEGPGYQMWETVSEGSPISPVFATPEELASYLVQHRRQDGSYESWMKMICGDGWAPSMMIIGGKTMSGVSGLGDKRSYSNLNYGYTDSPF